MKRKRILWILLSLCPLLFLMLPYRTSETVLPSHNLCGDSLRTYIAMPSEWYRANSYPIGFNYALLLEFNRQQHCHMEIRPAEVEDNPWDSLLHNKIDLLILNVERDTVPATYLEEFYTCLPIRQYRWYVRKSDQDLGEAINFWIGSFKNSRQYQVMEKQFFSSYDIERYLSMDKNRSILSPYDEMIQENAAKIGWDWRLLAALIYKESRFSIWVESPFGATGLMQVKPSTAAHYGIYNVYDPSLNLQAGTAHLNYLKRIYEQEGLDSANVIKFTLAAYNAGEGRIDDCMNFALSQGKDYKNWDEVAKVIPLMSDPTHYEGNIIKLGKFRGTQTLDYVESVLNIYRDYRTLTETDGK